MANSRTHKALAALELRRTLLDEQRRELSGPERKTLGEWTGWGPIAGALAVTPGAEWMPVADRLEELLSQEEVDAARDICDTSFYTPDHLIDEMFDMLRASGLTSGRVLEPGCGAGAFLARTPADMDFSWTGIDRDPVAASIAGLLAPGAEIITGRLEHHHLPDGSFDAVVGNLPFSKTRVSDPNAEAQSLHGYFIERAVRAVKPGGLIIVLTSRYTIDSMAAHETGFSVPI